MWGVGLGWGRGVGVVVVEFGGAMGCGEMLMGGCGVGVEVTGLVWRERAVPVVVRLVLVVLKVGMVVIVL